LKLPAGTKNGLFRLIRLAVIIELAWLVLINAVLQIPYTQTVINGIRPEKFHVSWESAWSPYPGRVFVHGASANGNSRSQIWQVDVDSASGSIGLLPLIFKHARIRNVNADNVTFRMRPRTKPDKDYSRIEAFFPVIEGREVTPAVTTPRKKKSPWQVAVNNIRINGEHRYWIYQLQGSSVAEIEGGLNYRTRGGPLELDLSGLDVDLGKHYLNGDYELLSQGQVTGKMGFTPFNPRENKGLALLDYLLLDVEVHIDVSSLQFIELFMLRLRDVAVDGSGLVSGRLLLDQGRVLDGTDLVVNARDLQVNVPAHRISGSGAVGLEKGANTGGLLNLGFRFRDLELLHRDDPRPVIAGDTMMIKVSSDGRLVPKPELPDENLVVGVEIGKLGVPDLAVFQGYLPPEFPLSITGGDAVLDASLQLRPENANGYIRLVSGNARATLVDQDLQADLTADIVLADGQPGQLAFDLSGSRFVLGNVKVLGQKAEFDDQGWSTRLNLTSARLALADPMRVNAYAELNASDSRPIAAVFRNQEGWRPEFIAKALMVEGIEGTAELEILGRRVAIPDSWVTSDNIEAGARVVFADSGSDGVVYLKYKKVDAVLKLNNGKKNIDLLGARKKYDAYESSH